MILVLNCGSQSLKWKVFNKSLKEIEGGEVSDVKDYKKILVKEIEKTKSFKIDVVGHRVVHGGDNLRDPVEASEKVLKEVEKHNDLAPLHNPYNIMGIKMAQKAFPKSRQVLVFDTGLYRDLPFEAATYALPEGIRKKYNIRRYGFHGISHEYAAREAARKDFRNLNIITCHLGGGSSITAFKKGKVKETSMGFTPLEGVVMMTRGGSIDPGIVLKIAKDLSLEEVSRILYEKSGMKGLCGEENMLKVLKRVGKGDRKAESALDIFVYQIQKCIGSYLAVLGRCDLLVFTGTIGAGSSKIRKMISSLDILKGAKVRVIDPAEELAIAKKINE